MEKVLIKKVGSVVKTELVSCSLLACDSKMDVLINLFSHLLTIGMNSSTFGFVKPSGNPRYVKGKVPTEQPKVLARRSSFSYGVLIGTIMDLWKLTFSPMDSEKELSKAFRKKSYLAQPSIMMRVSSAYYKMGKSVEHCRRIGNLSSPRSFALFKIDWRRSVARTKRRGDRGSPCLTPLL
jgi:hypothetical protein